MPGPPGDQTAGPKGAPGTSGGGGPGCFIAGTQILMPDGSTTPIENIIIGQMVRSTNMPNLPNSDSYPEYRNWYQNTHEYQLTDSIVKSITITHQPGYLIFNNRIGITLDQPIYVKRGEEFRFLMGEGLREGDYFVHSDGELEEITNITWESTPEDPVPVWRLNVEEVDTYYADGILAHNK